MRVVMSPPPPTPLPLNSNTDSIPTTKTFISFIVPAHNEVFEIAKALVSIFESARAVGVPFEVIVVNDDSTDRTPDIAREAGARVVDVKLRKISAVRNAGA